VNEFIHEMGNGTQEDEEEEDTDQITDETRGPFPR
jgi:hypothetical protein